MKTHPDSIFLQLSDVRMEQRVSGESRRNLRFDAVGPVSNFIPTVPTEFVPASAYLELRASTDQALQSELAHVKRLLSLTEARRGKLHEEISSLETRNIELETELASARATIAQLLTAETERPSNA